MNRRLNRIRSMVWLALPLGAALASCAPAPTPFTVAPLDPTPKSTTVPTKTPASTPTPGYQILPSASPEVWTPVPTSTPDLSVTIHRIQMIDSSTGWAEGQLRPDEGLRILRTSDGGSSWSDVSPNPNFSYGQSFFLDAQLAWAIAPFDDQAWRTRDGGQSWEPLGEDSWAPIQIWFNDPEHGWGVTGEPGGMTFPGVEISFFATTEDGGLTWHEANPPPGGGWPYLGFSSEQTAWVLWASKFAAMEGSPNLGVPIRLQTTFDGGETWTSRMLPLPPDAHTVDSDFTGTALGDVGNCEFLSPVYASRAIWKAALTCEAKSWLYTSANQGKTWIISAMPAGVFADVQFINPSVGWLLVAADGEGHLYQTMDGGQSWKLIKRAGWLAGHLSFLDAQTGWAVVCPYVACYGWAADRTLVKTTDGGLTWEVLDPQLAP